MKFNPRAPARAAAILAINLLLIAVSSLARGATETPGLSPHGTELWEQYLASVPMDSLQEDCKPRLLPPLTAVPYRGVAVLYHGYTACPQQFFELARLLNERGFAVVLPLLPGHGRMWVDTAKGRVDQTQLLPTGLMGDSHNYQDYMTQVRALNAVAAEFSGEHVVGGLSVGGAMAAAAAVDRPKLWQRQLIISPFFEIRIEAIRMLFGAISNTDRLWRQADGAYASMLQMSFGWGDSCEQERDPGYLAQFGLDGVRAGICDFSMTNVLGINQLGYETWAALQPTLVQTQYVAMQDDPLINQQLIFNGVGRLRQEQVGTLPFTTAVRFDTDQTVRSCYVPSDNLVCLVNATLPTAEQKRPCANHSLMSRYDLPSQNKYWITPFLARAAAFIVDGTFFPADSAQRSSGDPLCAGL